ncbi:MAG TPA: hypothetical protein VFG68_23805 [Fimbriiglobus sp.]|nr:hypothetical protein [Fimbriiglobus sp.]
MAYRHHSHRHHCRSRRGGAGKRVLYILAVGVVVAAAVSLFRSSSDHYVSPPPAPARMAGMSASKLQGYAADRGIVGGAAAAERELAARPTDPDRTVPVSVEVSRPAETARPVVELSPGKSKPAIKVRAKSDKLRPNRDMALSDALINAGKKIHEELRSLDPPVEAHPGWAKVKADYLRPDSVRYTGPSKEDLKALADQGIDGTHMVWAEIDAEVTDGQVRELRSEQRVGSGGLVAAVGFVLVLALFGFLRLDAWTKGYLTGGLAVAVVAAAGAAVALLVLA